MATAAPDQPSTRSPSGKAEKHSEGPVARGIEQYTAPPPDLFLWAAGGSIAASLVLHLCGRKDDSQFVGQRVVPILLLGVSNKIVKVARSDRVHGS